MWAAGAMLLASDGAEDEFGRLTVKVGRSMAEDVASGAGTSTSSASTWPIKPADETKADVRAALKRMMTNSYPETSGRVKDKFETPSRGGQKTTATTTRKKRGSGGGAGSLAYNLKLQAIVKGGLFSLVH